MSAHLFNSRLSQYPVLAIGQNSQSLRIIRLTRQTQVSVKLSHMFGVGLNTDTDPLLDLDDQIIGANVDPVRFSAHSGSIGQSGRHQQIDDAINDLGFVGLLTLRNVASSAMEVKQPLGRLPQFGFTGLVGALFRHSERN